jgi:transglutaminase-like putative cysteine protease
MKHLPLIATGLVLVLSLLADAAERFDPWTQTARYALEYRADLSGVPEGDKRRIWIPVPSETPSQRVLSMEVQAPFEHSVGTDSYGNRFIYLEPARGREVGEVVARYQVERSVATTTQPVGVGDGSRDDPQRYLQPARLIPLGGVIQTLSEREVGGLYSRRDKINGIYDYVYKNMTYSKEQDGWGNGDAVWACASKVGNCTDFHSLYIGMARVQSIPARFMIGFPIDPAKSEGVRKGYHCWAEVYDQDEGWIPFDASEAKKAGKKDEYFGTLPSDRVEFTLGRDLILEPAQDGAPINYIIYPYAEVDGQVIEKLPAALNFKRLPADHAKNF